MSDGLPPGFKTALVIVAHPDDAEFNCGGTVALWTGRGVAVSYVICTDGVRGVMAMLPRVMTPEELRRTRRLEQDAAASVLGVARIEFLEYPDGELVADMALKRELVIWIRRLKPDVVVCQNAVRNYLDLDNNHPDHLAAGQAAIEAIYPAAHSPAYFPDLLEQGLEPHTIRSIWVTGTAAPNHFVDVSATVEQKVEAIRCHATQYREDPREVVLAQMAALGRPHGIAHAEAFTRLHGRLGASS
ncbi:MAG: PIG-L deacetylase family protein [Candidatus Dormiibacterota bacterium]